MREPSKQPEGGGVAPSGPSQWSDRKRLQIMIVVGLVALVGPLTTTIYLPTLPEVQLEFQASDNALYATVSAFTAMYSISPLIWGPIADIFGRRWPLFLSTVIFSGSCALAGFAWSIETLIAARVLMAMGGAAFNIIGAGSIADVYPPERRGFAMGLYTLFPMISVAMGPLIGGAVSLATFGWRGVFYLVMVWGALCAILVFLLLPETLVQSKERRVRKPWLMFRFLKHPGILAVVMFQGVAFGAYFMYIVLLSVVMEEKYGFSPLEVGLAFLGPGVLIVVGNVGGGRFADWLAGKSRVDYRLIPTCIFGWLLSATLVMGGYCVTYNVHVAVLIAIAALQGFAHNVPRSGITTYSIQKAKEEGAGESAGSIVGVIMCAQWVFSSIGTQLSPVGISHLGYFFYMTIFGGTVVVVTAVVCVLTYRAIYSSGDKPARTETIALVGQAGKPATHVRIPA